MQVVTSVFTFTADIARSHVRQVSEELASSASALVPSYLPSSLMSGESNSSVPTSNDAAEQLDNITNEAAHEIKDTSSDDGLQVEVSIT